MFGWDANYDELVSSGEIISLHERRENLVLSFAKKAKKDIRFKHWFPEKDYGTLNLRREKKYEEQHARTERLRKSPIFFMRRLLNASN